MQADHDLILTPAKIHQPWDEHMEKSQYYPRAVVNKAILIAVLWKALFWRKKLSAVELSRQATTNCDPGWVYIVKYCCLHLAVVVHDFIQSVNQIFKAWFWTACKRLAFQCLCWIYGAPLAQILCSAWEHTRKYWFTLELIGIAAFWDIWILIALINLAIKTCCQLKNVFCHVLRHVLITTSENECVFDLNSDVKMVVTMEACCFKHGP